MRFNRLGQWRFDLSKRRGTGRVTRRKGSPRYQLGDMLVVSP